MSHIGICSADHWARRIKSYHSSIPALPTYRQKLKQDVPVTRIFNADLTNRNLCFRTVLLLWTGKCSGSPLKITRAVCSHPLSQTWVSNLSMFPLARRVYGHIQSLQISVCHPHLLQDVHHCSCTQESEGNWTKRISPHSIMKCFERLVKDHITSTLPNNLNPLQYAYRTNRSMIMQSPLHCTLPYPIWTI